MPERKSFLVGICSFCLVAVRLLPLIQYCPVLEDPEYDDAIARVETIQHPQLDTTKKYPFGALTRAEGAPLFAFLAKQFSRPMIRQDCSFNDLTDLDLATTQAIIDGCRYGYFK